MQVVLQQFELPNQWLYLRAEAPKGVLSMHGPTSHSGIGVYLIPGEPLCGRLTVAGRVYSTTFHFILYQKSQNKNSRSKAQHTIVASLFGR